MDLHALWSEFRCCPKHREHFWWWDSAWPDVSYALPLLLAKVSIFIMLLRLFLFFQIKKNWIKKIFQNIINNGIWKKCYLCFFFYRFEGQILRFGHLHIQNLGIDMATDPLFTITHLELWVEHDQEADDGFFCILFNPKICLYWKIILRKILDWLFTAIF